MTDLDWHVDEPTLERYGEGRLTFAAAASVDAHLTTCTRCQALASARWRPPAIERAKHALDATLDAPPDGVVERNLRRAGVGVLDAKVVSASPSLQGSWLVASLLGAAFAVAAASAGSGRAGMAAFLLLSPVVPLIGVALAFGPRVDPTYEVAIASPASGARIVLARTAAVAASTLPVLLALSALLPRSATSPLVWALPAVGLASAALALGTVIPVTRAAVAIGALWLLGSALHLSGVRPDGMDGVVQGFPPFQAPGQALFALLVALSAVVVTERRGRFEVAP